MKTGQPDPKRESEKPSSGEGEAEEEKAEETKPGQDELDDIEKITGGVRREYFRGA
jgi:hypothetical protein